MVLCRMNMILNSPSTILLPDSSEKVQKFLTYTDSSVKYQIKKMKDRWHWRQQDPEGFERRLNELEGFGKEMLADA